MIRILCRHKRSFVRNSIRTKRWSTAGSKKTKTPRASSGTHQNESTEDLEIEAKTENKCEIRPNLYIDCDDVEANHSALIDKFNKDELFYLYSKGINYSQADKLLTKGFLKTKITSQEIIDIINTRYGGE